MIKITKTSAQAKRERDSRKKESSCPECGHSSLGTYSSRDAGGFFRVKIQYKNHYSCFRCGCKWETEWRDKH